MSKNPDPIPIPRPGEEVFNAISHGIGAIAAVAGLVTLVMLTDIHDSPGYVVYGVSLVVLYLASTLYHSFGHPKVKDFFRKLDHMAIFLLIAGTYTPYCLSILQGWTRWTILGVIWTFAIAGIVVKSFSAGKFEWISLTFYVMMGWMVVFVIKPVYEYLSPWGFVSLLAGGLAYTLGTYFYMSKRIPFAHGIWHLWVLAGSVLHFFSVMTLVE